MKLNDQQLTKIKKRLQRSNRRIWTDEVLPHVFDIINSLRTGIIQKSDWFIPEMISYEDYILQLNLIEFI